MGADLYHKQKTRQKTGFFVAGQLL
ncbi:uncharacterized protein METZ01_LOCUS116742 [marine metagenome]|uniref:Uncharacterized protein n=1 Tax=marine metagenome TaxID=408172 RepID=A0A381XGN4_9ZZZZ